MASRSTWAISAWRSAPTSISRLRSGASSRRTSSTTAPTWSGRFSNGSRCAHIRPSNGWRRCRVGPFARRRSKPRSNAAARSRTSSTRSSPSSARTRRRPIPPPNSPTRLRAEPSVAPHREDRLKAAEDQAAGVEGRLARGVHARVVMHPLFGRLEGLLVGPDLPGEDDLLARLRGDCAAEVGLFAFGDEVLPALDDLQATVLLEERRAALGPRAIGVELVFRHGDDEAADVHGFSGSFGAVRRAYRRADAASVRSPHCGP